MAIKYERAVDQPETFAGEMILQIILLIVFLAWTLKRNLGEHISEIYCIKTICFAHFLLKIQKKTLIMN
jgi:hypothetical protein